MRIIDLAATGRNIKRLRLEAGLSVRDLQEKLGFVSPQAIYKWQNGLTAPRLTTWSSWPMPLAWRWMTSLSGAILSCEFRRRIELY